jgi:hypothetical protein
MGIRQMENATSFKLYCSAEWHLVRIGADYAPVVYSYAMLLSKNSGRFSLSIAEMAGYFGADPKSIRKAVRKLRKAGFLIKLREEPGRPIAYRPVHHMEWSKDHPGQCLEKVQMPWSGEEVDPLVKRLHAASDGRLNLFPNFVRGMRNTGHSDDAIVGHFESFYQALPLGSSKGIFGQFMKHLRTQSVVTPLPVEGSATCTNCR